MPTRRPQYFPGDIVITTKVRGAKRLYAALDDEHEYVLVGEIWTTECGPWLVVAVVERMLNQFPVYYCFIVGQESMGWTQQDSVTI